ncbi:hypothetical protein ILUMI_10307 [Ignelater luminosus]|uniref:CLIP domain-containing serine protease n=1 Tax=Ignelater luminosus TaxID=2038154 RepID=A0A8K0GBL3_IGNLU|nr:hypothetical protein ILUMI_10307 [Ignelater luminosus]
MLLQVVIVFAYLLVFGNSAERGEECVDQSGEKAVCTGLQSCRLSAPSSNSSTIGDKIQISISVCGYDNEPLVCCKTVSSAIENSVNVVSTASTVSFNNTTQTSQIESSTTSNSFNVNQENKSQKPLFTSPPLQTTSKTTEINNDNSIEFNNLPNVLPLQSNNTTSTILPTSTSPFIPITSASVETAPVSTFIETTTTFQPISFSPPFIPSPSMKVAPVSELIETTTTNQPISGSPLFIPTPASVDVAAISEFTETPSFDRYAFSKKVNKLLPDRNTCGFQNARERSKNSPIATIDEFPWTVLLKYRYGYGYSYDQNAGFRCMGTLISNRYVITAAECIINHQDLFYVESVRLGEWLIPSVNDCFYHNNGDECADKVVDVGIEKKILHPDYDPSCSLNNIALIRLKRNINYTTFIRPICLPVENLPEPCLGTILTTSGWGVTRHGCQLDLKSKINLPVLSNDKCINPFANFPQLLENQFCIGTTTSNTICLTDSGGGLMVISHEDKPQWYLEGVIPEGFACNQKYGPGIYTRVTKYIGWILDTISHDTF